MKNRFTLIELIVGIVVISILAAIIIPNIKGWQKEATISAIHSNIKNIQTSSDLYSLESNEVKATKVQPTILVPQPVDFQSLYPKHLRSFPKIEGMRYWIDYNGEVWGASVDAPSNIQSLNGELTWGEVKGATSYKVYEVNTGTTGSLSKKIFDLKGKIDNPKTTKYTGKPNTVYVISATDEYGLQTPPTGVGYTAYQNQKPVANINVDLENILTDTKVVWDTSKSIDPDGDDIVREEWQGKQESYPAAGSYTVKLRVQDSEGNWSEWVEKTFVVKQANGQPTAVIAMTPSTGITTTTNIVWSYANSTDPNNDGIVAAEWKLGSSPVTASPNGLIATAGTHTMQLRVKDSKGLWSEWVSKSFTVTQANRQPTAVISMTPSTAITTATSITWSYSNSTDADNDTIVAAEWQLDSNAVTTNPNGVITTAGSHTMKLRVKDSKGLWSSWVGQTFTVTQVNRPPTAVISMTPSTNLTVDTSITWSHSGSTDPDGDTITSDAEWQLDNGIIKIFPPNGKVTAGDHTMKLRVKDSKGNWSAWVSKDFTVLGKTETIVLGAGDLVYDAQTWTYHLGYINVPAHAKNPKITFQNPGGWKFQAYIGSKSVFYSEFRDGKYNVVLQESIDLGNNTYQLKGIEAGNSYYMKVDTSNGNGRTTWYFSGFKLTYDNY